MSAFCRAKIYRCIMDQNECSESELCGRLVVEEDSGLCPLHNQLKVLEQQFELGDGPASRFSGELVIDYDKLLDTTTDYYNLTAQIAVELIPQFSDMERRLRARKVTLNAKNAQLDETLLNLRKEQEELSTSLENLKQQGASTTKLASELTLTEARIAKLTKQQQELASKKPILQAELDRNDVAISKCDASIKELQMIIEENSNKIQLLPETKEIAEKPSETKETKIREETSPVRIVTETEVQRRVREDRERTQQIQRERGEKLRKEKERRQSEIAQRKLTEE
jgi:hypothetical protein